MNIKTAKFLKDTYRLKTLIRYNNTPRVTNESVAEHSFFTTLIVYRLYDEYDFDLYIALKMALFHDIPESNLSDIPNNTKLMFPEIAKAIKDHQKAASDMIDPSMTPLIEDFENQTTKEAHIVRLADLMSILQYTKYESDLGNRYMKSIYADVSCICTQFEETLKKYKRNKQS